MEQSVSVILGTRRANKDDIGPKSQATYEVPTVYITMTGKENQKL